MICSGELLQGTLITIKRPMIHQGCTEALCLHLRHLNTHLRIPVNTLLSFLSVLVEVAMVLVISPEFLSIDSNCRIRFKNIQRWSRSSSRIHRPGGAIKQLEEMLRSSRLRMDRLELQSISISIWNLTKAWRRTSSRIRYLIPIMLPVR